jgi:hypothetical protein
MEKDIEDKIMRTEQSIEQLSVELMEQKALRRHREECENLAKVVVSVPSCASTEKTIIQLREECDHLRKMIASKEAQESIRKKQFTLIMQSISDLQRSIAEEDSTQAMLLQLQQQLGACDEEDNDDDNEDGDEDGSRDKRVARGEGGQPPAKKARTEADEEGGVTSASAGGDEDEGETSSAAPSRNTSIDLEAQGMQDGDKSSSSSMRSPEGNSSRSSSPRPPPAPSARPANQSPSPSALLMHQKIQMISEPEEGEEDEATGGSMDTSK